MCVPYIRSFGQIIIDTLNNNRPTFLLVEVSLYIFSDAIFNGSVIFDQYLRQCLTNRRAGRTIKQRSFPATLWRNIDRSTVAEDVPARLRGKNVVRWPDNTYVLSQRQRYSTNTNTTLREGKRRNPKAAAAA